jgi:hypothetical protein
MGGRVVRGLAFLALAAVIGVTSCRAMVAAAPAALQDVAR